MHAVSTNNNSKNSSSSSSTSCRRFQSEIKTRERAYTQDLGLRAFTHGLTYIRPDVYAHLYIAFMITPRHTYRSPGRPSHASSALPPSCLPEQSTSSSCMRVVLTHAGAV